MKKISSCILAICLSVTCLAGCEDTNKKECDFRWAKTGEGHSKIMLCGCCEAPAVEEPHVDKDADDVCDVCGYAYHVAPTNHFLRNQVGAEWLQEITAEEIAEIKMITEAVGVAPGMWKNITRSSSADVIAKIFEQYYWLDTAPISKDNGMIAGGGAVTVTFILKDGREKSLYFNNGNYLDTTGNYFALLYVPKIVENDEHTQSYGYITYIGTGIIYDGENSVCAIPMDILEFIQTAPPSIAVEANRYIETEFGNLRFIDNTVFYLESNRLEYFELVGKTLDDLIKEYQVVPV